MFNLRSIVLLVISYVVTLPHTPRTRLDQPRARDRKKRASTADASESSICVKLALRERSRMPRPLLLSVCT